MRFKQWLRAQIDDRGWTQQEAADAFGVSHTTVGRWLGGSTPRYEHYESIARGLRLDLEIVLKEARVGPYASYEGLDETKSRLCNLVNEVEWNDDREDAVRTLLERYAARPLR